MKKEDLIITLNYLKDDAIRKGKEAKQKSVKDLYYGKALAYSNVLKLMEA